MNADEFLERLWTDVINAVDSTLEPDWAQVARLARYEAVFDWCNAYDEGEKTPAWWLARKKWTAPRWTAAVSSRPHTAREENEPFVDAARAWGKLLAAGVSPTKLAKHLTAEGATALAGIRALLVTFVKLNGSSEPDDLSGLHEAVLSADPSGHEAGPGSWPATPPKAGKRHAGTVGSGKAGPLLRLRRAHHLALSPDGTRVVAAKGGDVTDVATGKVVAKCGLLANTSSVAWSTDGELIAATSTSGATAICDAKTGARKHVLKMSCEGAAPVFSADGRLLFCGDWNGNVVAWNVETGRAAAELALHGTMISALSRTPAGVIVLVSHKPVPEELVVLSSALAQLGKRIVVDHGADIAVDARGDRVLIAGRLDYVQWCQPKTGAIGKRHPFERVQCIALSPDGDVFVATMQDGFRIGKTDDLARHKLVERKYASGRASFSSDGARVAISTWESGEVWDVAALLAG